MSATLRLTDHPFLSGNAPPKGGLYAWHKADALSFAEAANVASWPDESGNARTLTAGATNPTFALNQLSGRPAVRFSSGNPTPTVFFSYATSAFSSLTTGEIIAVIKAAQDPPTTSLGGIWTFGTDASSDHYPFTDNNVYIGWGSSVRKSCGNPTPSLAAYRVIDIWSATSDWAMQIDNAAFFSTTTNTTAFTATPDLGRSTSSRGFNGFMAEVLIYDHKLSSADRTLVMKYLKIKYPALSI